MEQTRFDFPPDDEEPRRKRYKRRKPLPPPKPAAPETPALVDTPVLQKCGFCGANQTVQGELQICTECGAILVRREEECE